MRTSCSAQAVKKAGGKAEATPPQDDALAELRKAAATPLLQVWLPIGVVLGILMLVDAAYSGDWSRIGAISKEQEMQLQGLVPLVVGGHGACAAAAGVISAKRGENWAPRALKTFGAGFVGLVEVALVPQE